MEIKIAEYCGFCYGVKRAVEMAENAAKERVKGGTLGPLIHNPQFIAELESKGIACKEDLQDFTAGETVIFRSHGVGPEIYQKAEEMQLNISTQLVLMCVWHRKKRSKLPKMAFIL